MIVGMYAWVHVAFDRHTALLTAAGLSVGFWPVMAARQSLRSITLPAIFVLVVWLFLAGNWGSGIRGQGSACRDPRPPIPDPQIYSCWRFAWLYLLHLYSSARFMDNFSICLGVFVYNKAGFILPQLAWVVVDATHCGCNGFAAAALFAEQSNG